MGIFTKDEEKTDKFILQLINQAEQTHNAITVLENSLNENEINEKLKKLKEINFQIEEIRRVLIDDLLNTFITPIDREDTYNISNALYDMVDYAYTTTEEIRVLKVKIDEYIREMVSIVKKQTEELMLAMQRLSKNPRVAGEHALRVKSFEKDVEKVYRKALACLFTENLTLEELPSIFYKREVYRHISNMADKAENAANVFGIVVMKLT